MKKNKANNYILDIKCMITSFLVFFSDRVRLYWNYKNVGNNYFITYVKYEWFMMTFLHMYLSYIH